MARIKQQLVWVHSAKLHCLWVTQWDDSLEQSYAPRRPSCKRIDSSEWLLNSNIYIIFVPWPREHILGTGAHDSPSITLLLWLLSGGLWAWCIASILCICCKTLWCDKCSTAFWIFTTLIFIVHSMHMTSLPCNSWACAGTPVYCPHRHTCSHAHLHSLTKLHIA